MNEWDRRQLRGNAEAYERYLNGMDASMRHKVALTAAHLLCVGRVADMGMGSGAGSFALAALYPSLDVVGVDLDPNMVELARDKHRRANLEFVVGDIAADVFAPESLDGTLNSSVLHHVTSFCGYSYAHAAKALAAQCRALRRHGTMVIRDFVAPSRDEDVLLDLPADDGDSSSDPLTCSSSALLERFACEFRSLHERPGFELERSPEPPRPGWDRFRIRHRHAVEFLLRKDYRADWVSETKEEYTYFTQEEFEAELAKLGMRVLASMPLRNPWILSNRFEHRAALRRRDGSPLDWPATNYLIAGEKVGLSEGVRFVPNGPAPARAFLQMEHYLSHRTGLVHDLVRRPHMTVDVVPYFASQGAIYVLARMSYPRPILSVRERENPALDQSRAPHYVTEPLNVLQTDRSLGQTVEEMLEAHVRIAPTSLRQFRLGPTYYPSPGGTQEEVRSVFVEISPVLLKDDLPNLSGFGSSGRVRAIEADQVLRAAQVGGLPDARLELNVYDLMLYSGRRPSAWIGCELELAAAGRIEPIVSVAALLVRPARRVFERVPGSQSARFLEIRCVSFEEHNAQSVAIARGALEYVVPRHHSANTVVCAMLARLGDAVYLGIEDDDQPAVQCFTGNSQTLVTPAWRLPTEVRSLTEAHAWAKRRAALEYGVRCGRSWDLGGAYFPSPGMSPEVAYPIAMEVAGIDIAAESADAADIGAVASSAGPRALRWVLLDEIVTMRGSLSDGHLRVVALRAAHALGTLERVGSVSDCGLEREHER